MSRVHRRELRRAAAVAVHRLEQRLLLSSPGVWVIKGDLNTKAPGEAIVVAVDPHDSSILRATINGALIGSRRAQGLKQIQIGAGRGADFVSVELAGAGDITVRVWGGRGNDTLMGDSGGQCLYGGPGDDVLDAGAGNDTLWGNNGDDDLSGGDGGDWMCGDAGDDTLAGNWGNDRLLGAAGNDFLDGGEDRDKVRGGPGVDTLKGGGGKDALNADDGKTAGNRDLVFVEWGIDGAAYNTNDRTKRENTRLPVSRVSGDQLRRQFRQRAVETWEGTFAQEAHYWGIGLCGGGGVVDVPVLSGRGLTAAAPAAPGADHSTTNVQEAGVDEADVVETDGRYIYSLTGYYGAGDVVITDIANNRVVAHYDIDGTATGLYLIGDRLNILSWDYARYAPPIPAGGRIAAPDSLCPGYLPYWYDQSVRVTVLDVSNPASPKKVEETKIDGNYVSSRAIDNRLYVVVTNSLDAPMPQYKLGADGKVFYESREDYIARLDGTGLDDALPGWTSTDAAGHTTQGLLWNDDNVYVTDPDHPLDKPFLSVALIDVADDKPGVGASATVSGYDGQVYASQRGLYVAQNTWTDAAGTDLFKFTLGADSIELAATANISGIVDGQFAMDEEGQYFRVATQDGPWDNQSSGVQVLDQVGDELRVVGSVGQIAPGERLYASRFVGDRAYLITFQQVDPLFAIDLSEPTSPKVAGELAIPGFSRYLQPIDETHIIGLGRSVENNRTTGIQLSLFDVADIAHPKRVATYDIPKNQGPGWQYSVAENDHHAFSYFPAQGVLAFPVTLDGYDEQSNYITEQRLEVVKIDPDKGFTRLGAITHDDEILRSVRIGPKVFSIGTHTIKVANLDDPSAVLATIELDEQ
jgi:uncharacterized secreted protein with C-terminal beta-propeller domain